jgi:hypothetical protein
VLDHPPEAVTVGGRGGNGHARTIIGRNPHEKSLTGAGFWSWTVEFLAAHGMESEGPLTDQFDRSAGSAASAAGP